MKKQHRLLVLILIPVLLFQSCIVSGPKYTHVEQVMQLQTGMTLDTVNRRLGITPYDFYLFDSTGNRSYVYKYRTTDRKTVPFFTKETNGKEKIGRYMDLVAYYDTANVAYRFESKPTDSKLEQKKINIQSVVTLFTVVVPALLVYLGIQKSNN